MGKTWEKKKKNKNKKKTGTGKKSSPLIINSFIGIDELSRLGIKSSKLTKGINNGPRKVQNKG